MWIPISRLPLASSRTENASSISVVVASSIENARTGASGSGADAGSAPHGAKAVPCGNACARNASKWYSCDDGIAPQRASSASGLVCCASHAAISAFHSSDALSGLCSSIGSFARSASGTRFAASSTHHVATSAASRFLRSTDASAALSASGRRLAVASLAALVEIHRRRRQRERHGGRFGRRRSAPEIFLREFVESEFVLGRHFPEKIRIELAREPLRVGVERRGRRLGEAQQHGRRLDLEALAGGRLDLQRRVVVGEDGAGLELAVVLEKDVHGGSLAVRPQRGRSGPGL